MTRVAVLWSGFTGYLNACLRELASRDGVEIFLSHQAPGQDAPYDQSQFAWIGNRLTWRTQDDLGALPEKIEAFAPDVMIMAGWHIAPYRRLAKKYANTCWRVMLMDNAWNGTLKQRLGTLIAPFHLRPAADVAWVPGERQSIFARKMGFSPRDILRGSLSCDRPRLSAVHRARIAASQPVPRAFIFLGRLVPSKGIDTLVRAYRIYRDTARDPWPLICCGAGPLRAHLEGEAAITVEGFVQPGQMPARLAAAGCLVLPSDFEPWALVVHEAASAGLLVLASEAVGAAVHLVQPNYNGFIFGRRDAEGLAALMMRVGAMSNARLDAMSHASHLLSEQYSPERWADTLLDSLPVRVHGPSLKAAGDAAPGLSLD
ncbi:MAG: glycosyltransferase family 4 protein [Terracidiphilus sp.]